MSYIKLIEEILNQLVPIPQGTFLMGSDKRNTLGFSKEYPQHLVDMPAFYMSKYLITQKQWKVISQLPSIDIELDCNPRYRREDNYPIENINWYEALEFCNRISVITGKNIMLPSESQWEYCCKAGTNTTYSFGDNITPELANYNRHKENVTPRIKPIGSYPSNPWGLYDMHGNINEWCLDDWHINYENAPTDGSPWLYEKNPYNSKILRGGNYYSTHRSCTSTSRYLLSTYRKTIGVGFRICYNP